MKLAEIAVTLDFMQGKCNLQECWYHEAVVRSNMASREVQYGCMSELYMVKVSWAIKVRVTKTFVTIFIIHLIIDLIVITYINSLQLGFNDFYIQIVITLSYYQICTTFMNSHPLLQPAFQLFLGDCVCVGVWRGGGGGGVGVRMER